MLFWISTAWAAISGASLPGEEPSFFFRDGDRVVVAGDSITVEGHYVRYLENFVRTRFPAWQFAVRNAGTNGQVAARACAVIETDVLVWNPSVVIINYGMNDGRHADGLQRYQSGIVPYVDQLLTKGIRVVLCSNTPVDIGDRPGEFTSHNQTFAAMAAFASGLARERGIPFVDQFNFLHRVWGENRRRAQPIPVSHQTLVSYPSDFVHARGPGQTTMAYIILKTLGAPAEVGWAEVDVASGATQGRRSRITGLTRSPDHHSISFVRTDEAAPCWIDDRGPFPGNLGLALVPFTADLNRLPLRVKGLPAGRYELTVDNFIHGVFSAEQFAAGVDLATDPRSPLYAPGRRVDEKIRTQAAATKAARDVCFFRPPDWLGIPELAAQQEREFRRRMSEIDSFDAILRAAARSTPYTCRLVRRDDGN